MAHIHLEDGAFTLFWVVVWSLLAAGIISAALLRNGGNKIPTRKLAIAAMCVAVGFAIFQVEIPVFGGVHINLTPLMGILLGPSLGTLSVLVINIFSAAIGHGGWGMIGANTIVNVVEVVLGYYMYKLLRSGLRLGRFPSGFGAAAIALTISAFVVVGIVGVSELQDSAQTRDQTFNNMLVLAAANIVTGLVEGVVTGYMVTFIGRVRPDLLEESEGGGRQEKTTQLPGEATHV
jgi:cobalt/nickel transport system permease protein